MPGSNFDRMLEIILPGMVSIDSLFVHSIIEFNKFNLLRTDYISITLLDPRDTAMDWKCSFPHAEYILSVETNNLKQADTYSNII